MTRGAYDHPQVAVEEVIFELAGTSMLRRSPMVLRCVQGLCVHP